MARADQQGEEQKDYDKALGALHESVGKLGEHSRQHLRDRYGVSGSFKEQIKDQESALAICDRAMAALSGDYVEHMSAFKHAEDPIKTLHHLEEAEAMWEAESTLIKHLDAEGGEAEFLRQMREFAFCVLEDRLDVAAKACHKDASPENIAVCVGILGTMDRMLAEFGHPVESEQRKDLRDVILKFQS